MMRKAHTGCMTDDPSADILSKALRRARSDRGLTQKDVAALMEVDQSTYQRYESGISEPERDRGLWSRIQAFLAMDDDAFHSLMVETAFQVRERRHI